MSIQYPKVAAVVLSWNRRDEVLETISLLNENHYPNLQIMVVDNASSDGTREAVSARYPRVEVLSLPYNVGISGWDFGIANTAAEYIVCLDDDSAPDPDAIERMVALFERSPRTAIVPFNIYGGAFSTEEWAAMPASRMVGYINCGVGLRRCAVVEAGFNDRDFFLYSNEWDLAVRILNRGHEIAFDPAIRAHHRTAPAHRSYKRLRTLSTRNEAWMAMKYFQASRVPLLLLRVLVRNANQSRVEGLPSLLYVLQGMGAALLRWRVAWAKREKVRPEVLRRYERGYWAFRPFTASLRSRIKNMLKVQQEEAV